MDIDEHQIRRLAHQIWESEGRPEGQHERHWHMARRLAEAQRDSAAEEEEQDLDD